MAEHFENPRMNQSCISSWQKCSLCPASAWWCLTSNSWQRIFLPRGTASYVRRHLAPSEREDFPLSQMDHLTPSCFISDTFSFHGFPFYLVTKPCVFAWSHLSLKMAAKELSSTHFFSSNMPPVCEQIQPKNPVPNPDYVSDATKQNIPTEEAQAKTKMYLFFLINQKLV